MTASGAGAVANSAANSRPMGWLARIRPTISVEAPRVREDDSR